ncbi:hypothetical protein [Kordia sp.]|uniref:hypothetical protein n=1 Tax=Kordia sp. TaxID=1965332 RepID=UPI003B5B2C74
MKIKSNAAPQELNSLFFVANEKFCHDFERFIASKNGMVKGNYNAWSYTVLGKIESKRNWNLKYKKAIYSSTGSLFSVFYKNEVLLDLAEWTCVKLHDKDISIFIRKRRFLDNLSIRFSRLKHDKNYVIKTNKNSSKFFSKIIQILNPLFEEGKIYTIRLKNDKLTIQLRSNEHHFDIFDALLSL